MKQSQEVIVARIIAASKAIVKCQQVVKILRNQYYASIRDYLHTSREIDAHLIPGTPEYHNAIAHTSQHIMALNQKKRELHNARRRHSRATQALIKYQTEKENET
ncbi:hypothetical protein ACWWJF_20495 [Symbiopectobacterium sp. Eva_TO]